jgi:fused signal recognition particle receptor
MLASDVGPKTTSVLLGRLRESVERNRLQDADAVWAALRSEATRILAIGGGPLRFSAKPTVVLMVGVNGVGKTTTIGKLATHYITSGKRVVLAAGDTFRAAAVQQLEVWGKRVGAAVVKGKEAADPGAVAFDATTMAREGGADLLLVDTAGRLHTKVPLMDEIKKVRKTISKAMDGAPHETLLVLDATTGQNALAQAAMFKDALELTGIVLTKLDGTAKGGVVLGICDELNVPVRYIGLGERADDLREFDAEDFVEALFGKGDEAVAAA